MESSGALNPQGDFNNINYNKIGIIKEYKTEITVYTECYCKNKLNDRKIEYAFYRVSLQNEIEKGKFIPCYLENIYFRDKYFKIYIYYHKEEDIEIIKNKIYNRFCRSFSLG